MSHVIIVGIGLVALGVGLGWLLGGRLSAIVDVRLRALWLVWLVSVGTLLQWWDEGFLLVPFLLVASWVMINLTHRSRLVGLGLGGILIGLGLNGVAIAANSRMPYSIEAARSAGLEQSVETARNAPAVEVVNLPWLADIFPVGLLRMVVSVGDILLASAVVVLVAALMLVDRTTCRRGVEQ